MRLGAKALGAALGLLAVALAGTAGWPAALTGADLGPMPGGKKQSIKAGDTARGEAAGQDRNTGRQSSVLGSRREGGRSARPTALSGSDLGGPSGGGHAAKRGKNAKVRTPGRGRKKSPQSATWTRVPSLIGQSQSWAKNRATESGLVWECFAEPKSTRPVWTVSAQSPAAGTKVKRGTRVIIWVAGLQGTLDPEVERKRAAALKRGARK